MHVFEINDLILRLTPEEKRFWIKNETNPVLIGLYDYIRKHKFHNPEFSANGAFRDEALAKNFIENELHHKQYSRSKTMLFNSILEILANRPSTFKNNARRKVLKLFLKIDLLEDKGLTQLCAPFIKKAKELIEKYELFEEAQILFRYQSKFVLLERNLNLLQSELPILSEWSELQSSRNETLRQATLVDLKFQIPLLEDSHANNKKSQQLYGEIISNPILEKGIDSLRAEMLLKSIQAVHFNLTNADPKKILSNYEELLYWLEEDETIISEFPDTYIASLLNAAQYASYSNEEKKYDFYIKKLNKFQTSSEFFTNYILVYSVISKISFLKIRGRFEEALEFIEASKKSLSKIWVPHHWNKILLSQYAYIYWSLGNYQKSYEIFSEILYNDDFIGVRNDMNLGITLQALSCLGNLILLDKKINMDEFKNLVLRAYRYISKQIDIPNKNKNAVQLLKRFLSQFYNAENFSAANLEKFKQDLVIEMDSNSKLSILRMYIDLEGWLDSLILKTPYKDVFKISAFDNLKD